MSAAPGQTCLPKMCGASERLICLASPQTSGLPGLKSLGFRDSGLHVGSPLPDLSPKEVCGVLSPARISGQGLEFGALGCTSTVPNRAGRVQMWAVLA